MILLCAHSCNCMNILDNDRQIIFTVSQSIFSHSLSLFVHSWFVFLFFVLNCLATDTNAQKSMSHSVLKNVIKIQCLYGRADIWNVIKTLELHGSLSEVGNHGKLFNSFFSQLKCVTLTVMIVYITHTQRHVNSAYWNPIIIQTTAI